MTAGTTASVAGHSPAALHIDNAQSYLDRLIHELHQLGDEKKQPLVTVLEYLSEHIKLTREEIGALRPGNAAALSATADELEETVAETARAANEIMSAAEIIETIATETEPRLREALQAATTRIYEASAFQDITGQRITKVVRALQQIEVRITVLAEACGEAFVQTKDEEPAEQDLSLLNGPQLGKHAATQSEIDSLFDSIQAGPCAL